ncbi:hypothetical protein [Stieleria varia]|uniref:Phytase-like domain-containing protein n=1 Tax=Stieleria varia TaxID=2528005 RepID=A0A5C6AZQ3_9BACT|nr:hypothetical protein [Stieleria varia]TWU04506.1 hypothetical protein Pla52n_25470 [Stieleria varia]
MLRSLLIFPALLAVAAGAILTTPSHAAMPGLKPGKVVLESMGPMTFAGSGVLLLGDPKAATVYAINTEDVASEGKLPEFDNLGATLTDALKLSGELKIGDIAVNPETGNLFVSISTDGATKLVRIGKDGKIGELDLDQIEHARKVMPNAPKDAPVTQRGRTRNPRDESITDVAFFDGKVLVTGVAAKDSPSQVLEFPYPFGDNTVTTSVEIFHAAHGRVEDATIRTFVPMSIGGEPTLLAGFTCTPLVRFPIAKLGAEEKVRGTTVAELGNRNQPIDMVVYEKGGATFVLMNNTARGVMKITTDGISEREGLTDPVKGGGTAGQPFETIAGLDNVLQMDRLDENHAVLLTGTDGSWALKQIELP